MREVPLKRADPLVSVVLATNRGGPFLREALASVVGQSYSSFDLVVVDDGSKDPEEIQSTVADFPAARLLRTEPAGVSAARNRGVDESSGDLVAFIDDDDRWHPDRLRQHVEVMERSPRAIASYCRIRTIDVHGSELTPGDQRPSPDGREIVRGTAGVMAGNLMVRRSVYEQVGGFDRSYSQAEDLDLVLKLVAQGSFEFVDEVLVDYRHHVLNTTRSHRDLSAAIHAIIAKHLESARSLGSDEFAADLRARQRSNDRFAAWSAARAARGNLRDRRVGAAISEVAWAARFAPTAPLSWLRRRLIKKDAR